LAWEGSNVGLVWKNKTQFPWKPESVAYLKRQRLVLVTIRAKNSMNEDIVWLDVSGESIKTSRATLTNVSDTMLYDMFAGQNDELARKQEDGSYFIDADPRLFKAILQGLRRGCVDDSCRPSDVAKEMWIQELDYWQIAWIPKKRKREADPDPCEARCGSCDGCVAFFEGERDEKIMRRRHLLAQKRYEIAEAIWEWIKASALWQRFEYAGSDTLRIGLVREHPKCKINVDAGECRTEAIDVISWLDIVSNRHIFTRFLSEIGYTCSIHLTNSPGSKKTELVNEWPIEGDEIARCKITFVSLGFAI
jgi:hypothetical protein